MRSSAVLVDVSLPLCHTRLTLSQRPASVQVEEVCDAANPDEPGADKKGQQAGGSQLRQSHIHVIKIAVPHLLLKNTSSRINSFPLPPLLQRAVTPTISSATAPSLFAYSDSEKKTKPNQKLAQASFWAATRFSNTNGDLVLLFLPCPSLLPTSTKKAQDSLPSTVLKS